VFDDFQDVGAQSCGALGSTNTTEMAPGEEPTRLDTTTRSRKILESRKPFSAGQCVFAADGTTGIYEELRPLRMERE
jgi:hypothetical protein